MQFSCKDKGILSLAEEDLARSGITLQDALALGMDIVDAPQLASLGHRSTAAGGIVFPYWDPFAGNGAGAFTPPKTFHRVRLLGATGGFAAQTKQQRYIQPPGTLNSVYVPKLVAGAAHNWAVFLKGREPVYITEGEKKAIAACAAGFPTLGLGGVDVYRSQKRGVDALPLLAECDWRTRLVFIVFDTDNADGLKLEVLRSAQRLMDWLVVLGAAPELVILPPNADGGKQGWDDYLVRHGKDTFVAQVLDARRVQHSGAKHLIAAAERFTYVSNINKFIATGANRLDDPRTPYSKDNINDHLGQYQVTLPRPKQRTVNGVAAVAMTPTPVPIADALLQWAGLTRCRAMMYAPGEPRILKNSSGDYLNMWTGWRAEYEQDWVPSTIDYERVMREWDWVLDNVFCDDTAARQWVEHWLYYPLKYPGTKLHTFVLICSRQQGIGKSFIGDMLAEYVYGMDANGPQHAVKIMEGRLAESFNSYLYAKSLVLGEDIAAHDKKSVYEKVKALTTSPTVEVNIKNVPQFMIENRANFWLTSNDPAPFFLADTDRRAFVHVPRTAELNSERFGAIAKLFASGLAGKVLLWHARNRYVEAEFNPKASAPLTTGKLEVMMNGMDGVNEWLDDLRRAAEGGMLSRPYATINELLARMELDAHHLRNNTSDRGLGVRLANVGCVRACGGRQVVYRLNGVHRPVRVWHLSSNPEHLALTAQEVERGLLEPFEYRVLGLKGRKKY